MMRTLLALLGIVTITWLTPLVSAEPPSLKMDDFAYGAELSVHDAELRRFELTPHMIKNIKQHDLGDVRIFDGNNKLIPSLTRKKDGEIKISRQALSFSRQHANKKNTAYILDRTSNHEQSLKSLSLQWQQGSAPNMLLVRVEHSADKKSWKILKESEAVNNFKFEGIVLKQNVIDINDYTQRYIRITFLNNRRSHELASVHAYTTNNKISDYTWIPAGHLQPQTGIANSYRFKLEEGIQPELLKLSFPKLNSILTGSLNTIQTVNGKLQYKPAIKNFNAYVVTINNKVVKSRPVSISRWQSSDWLITAKALRNIEEAELPAVTLAYPQYEVVFANNGEGPYTAVWGNPAAGKPMTGDIYERIKNRQDIAEVTPGNILSKARLTELMKSRETPWLMISISLAVLVIATASFVFGYRRYRLAK